MPSRRRVVAGVGGAATASLAGCLGGVGDVGDIGERAAQFSPGSDDSTNWPMPRYDPRQSAFAADAAAPRDGATERWRTGAPTPNGAPVVADGVVYLPRAAGLTAYDAATGEERWTHAPAGSPWAVSPLVDGGTAYVAFGSDLGLHALDAETGAVRWTREDVDARVTPVPTGRSGGEDADADGAVDIYAGSERTGLHRLDGATGETAWTADVFGVPSAVATDGSGGLYAGTEGGETYAFDDGGDADEPPREGWREGAGGAVESLLPTDDGLVVQTASDPLRCRRGGARVGRLRWEVPREYANGPPVRAGAWVFAAGFESLGSVRGRDAAVGWRRIGRFDAAPPVAAGDTLYVGNGRGVHAFALSGGVGVGRLRFGGKRWTEPLDGTVEGLAVADGALFAAASGDDGASGTLVALDPV